MMKFSIPGLNFDMQMYDCQSNACPLTTCYPYSAISEFVNKFGTKTRMMPVPLMRSLQADITTLTGNTMKSVRWCGFYTIL